VSALGSGVETGRRQGAVSRVAREWPTWMPAAAGALGAGLVFLLAHRALVDDAYITISYARTLAEHGQWAMQPGPVANTATSPLNVLLLAAITAVTGKPVLAVGVLLVATFAVIGAALTATGARLGWSPWAAPVAVGLLVVNPLLVSVIAMETHLALGLVALLGWTLVTGRTAASGVLCGLLVLTRPDLVAFALAALLAVLLLNPGRRLATAARVVGAAVAVALPWFAASWWWLGSAVPDTFLIKMSESMGDRTFANGLWFFYMGYPFAVVASLVPAVAGLIVLVVLAARAAAPRRLPATTASLLILWGVGAVLHIGVYLLLNTAPYQWYYGPAIGALSMLAAMAVGPAVPRVRTAVLAGGLVLIVITSVYLAVRPWTLTTISGNWAAASEYAELARRAPAGAVVETFGEVGTLAFHCECTVKDRLADRGQFAQLLAEKRAAATPLVRLLLDWNYARFEPPPPLQAQYEFAFAEDPNGVHVTSWRDYAGQMVVRPKQAADGTIAG
jgi:hypothetical protein